MHVNKRAQVEKVALVRPKSKVYILWYSNKIIESIESTRVLIIYITKPKDFSLQQTELISPNLHPYNRHMQKSNPRKKNLYRNISEVSILRSRVFNIVLYSDKWNPSAVLHINPKNSVQKKRSEENVDKS